MPTDLIWDWEMRWWQVWHYRDGFLGWQWYFDEVRDETGRALA